MRDHIVRLVLLCVLMLLVTSDLSIKDLLKTKNFSFLGLGRLGSKLSKEKRTEQAVPIIRNSPHFGGDVIDRGMPGQNQDENSEVNPGDLQLANAKAQSISPDAKSPTPSSILKGIRLTDEEKVTLAALRAQWSKILQEHCLPKLVCELHAAVTDGTNAPSDAERGLLSLIKDTSLGTAGEIVSRYHFAAHMGQLLSGVEGNGCHNFYPSCPISGTRVLQLVRAVRV